MKLKACLAAALLPALSAVAAEAPSVERGRYLVGFQGPWGTSHPPTCAQ